MVDVFAQTGIDPAAQAPDAAASNVELNSVQPTTLEAMEAQTPKFAPLDAIKNVGAMSVPAAGGDASQPDISQPVGQSSEQPSGDLSAGTNMTPPTSTTDQTPTVQPPTFADGSKDVLAAHDLPAPSLTQTNQNAFSNGVDLSNPQGPEQTAVADYANNVQDGYNKIAQTRYTPDEMQALKDKGPISFFELYNMQNKARGKSQFYSGPFQDTIYDSNLTSTANDLAAGKQVSDGAKSQLQDYIDLQTEISQRGLSWSGKLAQNVAPLPSIIASFAGAAALAPETGGASLEGEAVAAKPALQAVGDFIKTGLQRAPYMPGVYIPQYAEMRLNDSVAVTDKGDMIYKTAQEAPALAALKSYGYTAAMSVGQEFAEPIANQIGAGVEAAGKAISPILNSAVSKLPVAVQDALFSAYKAIQPNATLSQTLSAVGWKGMLGQLGANRVTDALNGAVNAATDKNYTFDDYIKALQPSPDQWALEAGLLGVAGGVHAATNLGMNILTEKGIKPSDAAETMKNMSAQEREDFVTHNTPDPTSSYPEGISLDEFENFHNEAMLGQQKSLVDNLNTLRNPPAQPQATSLLSFLKDNGGIQDEGGELSNLDTVKQRPGLVNSKGMTLDDAALTAQQGGYFPGRNLEQGDRVDINDLLDKVHQELGGDKVFSQYDQDAISQHQGILKQNQDLEAYLSAHGLSEDMADTDIIKGLGLDVAEQSQPVQPTPDDIRNPVYADAIAIDNARAARQLIDPPRIQEQASNFNTVYRTNFQKWYLPIYSELFNDIEAIQELSGVARRQGATIPDGEDSKLLANAARMTPKLVEYNLGVATAHFDENGNMVETGKGLKSIYDDLDNAVMDIEPDKLKRHTDFSDYQIAHSLMEDQAAGRLEVTPKQQGKYVDNLMRLADKYGEKFKWFDTLAHENYEWRNRILENLVRTGEWTQEKYNQTITERSKYAPLGRILDESFGDAAAARPISRGGLGQDPNPRSIGSLKQRGEGNDLEIRDTFKSDIQNSARIIQKSSVNNMLRSIYKFKDFYPDDVKEAKPLIKSQAVQGTYDPKLRAKLEEGVKFLGGDVQRLKSVDNAGGPRGKTLGSYSPMEDTVRLKIGSTEGVLAHEMGHQLDEKLGLKDKLLSDPEIKTELQTLAEDRLNSDITLRHDGDETSEAQFQEQRKPQKAAYLKYVKSDPEVIANFFDAYVNSPDQVDDVAPKAKAAFEQIIDSDPKLAFLKDIKPSTSRAVETLKPTEFEHDAPHGAIPFYENGQRKFMALSPEIYKAFNNFSPQQMGTVEKFLRATIGTSSKILREGATLAPSFMLQHLERSVFTSFLNSEGKATPVDFAKGMWKVMGKSEEYKKWAASSGALKTFMGLDEESLDKAYTHIFKDQNIGEAIKSFLPTVRETSDYSGRVAVYEKYKEQGISDLRAGLMSLEATGNYARGGTLTKKLNPYVPFLNDTVQGADRFFRSFAKNPAAYTLRAMSTMTLAQMAITGYYLYAANDKDRQEYLRFPEYERKEFFMFKTPISGDNWVKIRRPFQPGYLFGYVPESMMLHAYNNNMPEGENYWRNLFGGLASSAVPVSDASRLVPPALRAWYQTQSNYDLFKEKPIFTQDKFHPVPSEQEIKPGTSETAQLVGKTFGISPAKFDENVDTLTGTVGRKILLPASDAAIDKIHEMQGANVPAKPTGEAADSLLGNTVFARTPDGYATQPAIDFFKNYDALQKQYDSLPPKSSKFDRMAAAPGFDILQAARKEMSSNNKEITQIMENQNMSADDKAAQIKVRQDNIARIAEQANQSYYQQRGNRK